MKRSKTRSFKREGCDVEYEACQSDSYAGVAKRAAIALGVSQRKSRDLFTTQGTVIARDLTVDGRHVQWTLGNYMQAKHVGPQNVALGMGNLSLSDESDDVSMVAEWTEW